MARGGLRRVLEGSREKTALSLSPSHRGSSGLSDPERWLGLRHHLPCPDAGLDSILGHQVAPWGPTGLTATL